MNRSTHQRLPDFSLWSVPLVTHRAASRSLTMKSIEKKTPEQNRTHSDGQSGSLMLLSEFWKMPE